MEFKQLFIRHQTTAPVEKRQKSTHITEAERENYIKEWQKSHLTQRRFCDQNGLNIKTFHSWIKKSKNIKIADSREHAKTQRQEHLIAENNCTVELQFPKGVTIILRGPHKQNEIITLFKRLLSCNFI